MNRSPSAPIYRGPKGLSLRVAKSTKSVIFKGCRSTKPYHKLGC